MAAGVPYPSIPGGFNFDLPRSVEFPIHPFPDHSPPATPAAESRVKIRVKEMSPLQVERLKRQIRRESSRASTSTIQRERGRRVAIEAARDATETQHANEMAVWEHRAAEYQRQLDNLQRLTETHAATSAGLQSMLNARAKELTALQLNLEQKDATIQEIQEQSRDLGVKLDAVQLELRREREEFDSQLRREREIAAAERERELLALEEKMRKMVAVSQRV